jgi:NADPH-dependent 2,4-dienoyl-CoA reductase/sulfur reductase-like enzyme
MEAARMLSEKGHKVSLWEKDKDLGGTARIAGLAYEPNERLVHYLAKAVKALPIAISMGRTATAQDIVAAQPDHVILATGALRNAPPFPGKDQRHVFDGDQLRGVLFGSDPEAIAKLNPLYQLMLCAARLSQMMRNITVMRFLSKLWMPIPDEVVIIGGGLVGLELAEYLVERRRKVTILEPGPSLGAELSIVRRARVLHLLREHGTRIERNVVNCEIGSRSVHFDLDGTREEVACKQVIIAMGAEADNSLEKQLADSGIAVDRIGDCRTVGYIDGAILDARTLVQRLKSTREA